ncbi:hypothetical protein [Marinifaba aquimaris]|uniref:hypothetical protein n=1 Tax=Marinifaba aquimaris TaxID=2741323 RepID=UPI001FEA48E3|nr:hypothetical protein [Marinifaba aquimaris]
MNLSETESQIYQNILKPASELSLNLMAIKVTERPEQFLPWCQEFMRLCSEELNLDLLEAEQFPALKKLQTNLELAINYNQIKTLRIAPWPIFASFIQQQAELHALTERMALLDYVAQLKEKSLTELISEDLFVIAGKHTAKHEPSLYPFDLEWFGSTKSAKTFLSLLSDHDAEFDQALSHIPLTGDVSAQDYKNFVIAYHAIFAHHAAGEKVTLAPATRLLAMRRPDQFIALTNSKIETLCAGFDVAKFKNTDFDAYWSDLIESMRSMAWWRSNEPEDAEELKLWKNRAILVDCCLYADKQLAANSNYIRLRDKPKRASSAGSGTTARRSKASAQELVDRALASDDMPDAVKAQRDSIIRQVEGGKRVEDVISLLRTIFG